MIRKSFCASLMLCSLAACGWNVGPGDDQYPVLNKNAQRPLDVTLIQAPTVRAVFPVYWYADYWEANQGKCTYWGSSRGVPARLGYSIMVPLSFNGSGKVLHSKFAFDMYEPGLCNYKFIALDYRAVPRFGGSNSELIQYKDDPSLPNEVSVDLWCYPDMGSVEDDCDSIFAASVQNINAAAANRRPWLPTPEQAAAAKANGDKEPPALVGPNTRSLIIRVHDARIN
jgi:hypothetical protein